MTVHLLHARCARRTDESGAPFTLVERSAA